MVFSSIPFLFFFFPVCFGLYYMVPKRWKNLILLIVSLLFYAWGEPIYIVLLLFSSLVDYFHGRMIEKYHSRPFLKRCFLISSIVINLGLLGFFKYSDLLLQSFNQLFGSSLPLLGIGLPIGISFFTFQTMSYSIDVYRGDVPAEKNFLTFMAYVSMFPQLIAGPIVRYETVSKELKERDITISNFSTGFGRFLEGLFKKVLLANTIGLLWQTISTLPINEMTIVTSWLGLIAFAFQIYFDFSGYSDMAIGMGKMLGFHYLENFNYPYIASSITDFWRRWHISLSSWFRDYVYIPLGGSRGGTWKTIHNLLLVWMLTGLWHGAAWNFLLWGLYFGILLILEKFIFRSLLKKLPSFFQHLYALFFILIGWLLFAFDDFTLLQQYACHLIQGNFINQTTLFLLSNYGILLFFGFLFSTPIVKKGKEKLEQFSLFPPFFGIIEVLLFLLVVVYLVSDTYNPFLYFRF